MRRISTAPTRTGSHAPSKSFSVVAKTKAPSTRISGNIRPAADQKLQRQSFQMTMKPRMPAVSTVVATAST
jgi:hypothetical protein